MELAAVLFLDGHSNTNDIATNCATRTLVIKYFSDKDECFRKELTSPSAHASIHPLARTRRRLSTHRQGRKES